MNIYKVSSGFKNLDKNKVVKILGNKYLKCDEKYLDQLEKNNIVHYGKIGFGIANDVFIIIKKFEVHFQELFNELLDNMTTILNYTKSIEQILNNNNNLSIEIHLLIKDITELISKLNNNSYNDSYAIKKVKLSNSIRTNKINIINYDYKDDMKKSINEILSILDNLIDKLTEEQATLLNKITNPDTENIFREVLEYINDDYHKNYINVVRDKLQEYITKLYNFENEYKKFVTNY